MQNRQPEKTSYTAAALLGYSDGPIKPSEDCDPLASRLGGRPLWLDPTSAVPERSTGICENCGGEMVMIVQAYVPLEDSAYDRSIYVWACNRRACAGKTGAAKAVRGHLLNKEYALKLVKRKRAASAKSKSAAKSKAALDTPAASATVPKFDFGSVWLSSDSGSTKSTGSGNKADRQAGSLFSGTFGSGSLFGGAASKSNESPTKSPTQDADQREDELLAKQLGQLDIIPEHAERVDWPEDISSVPAQYLEFDSEELADGYQLDERYRDHIDQAMELVAESARTREKKAGGTDEDEWADEKYERAERPKGTDVGFERFVRMVSQNPEQVMRYQFGGEPLLYSMQDETAQKLGVSKCDGDSDDDDEEEEEDEDSGNNSAGYQGWLHRRGYRSERLPRCEHCNGRRVYECQLMPALLSVLPLAAHAKPVVVSSGERLVGSQLLQTVDLGLEFGTVIVFVCENDCHGGLTGTDYLGKTASSMDRFSPAAYYNELVLVQMETHVE
ncbi:hypothetical protein GGI15_001842 [Coemansia interrupta]|uniref:Programmed cell death protein 2 C-terminal domain-containing protein n=1 Tax=Coemansia interrupta TaxID=1126814 RepID=A0A9W8HMS4_9FUNG|nr:hypothetical protein GGI15_001842 [Coemansia interrupta]